MLNRFTGRYLLFLLLLSFFLSASPAQQSLPDAPPSNQQTVIRSSVRLVQVSVVVEDKKGNPVTNLKPEDFTLLDDGNPQKIAFFTPATPPPAEPQSQAAPRASLLPPNAFTNRYDLTYRKIKISFLKSLSTGSEDEGEI